MIYEFTLEERSQLEAIDQKYEKLGAEKEAQMSLLKGPDPEVEVSSREIHQGTRGVFPPGRGAEQGRRESL